MQNNDILECLLVLMETVHLEFQGGRPLAEIIQEPQGLPTWNLSTMYICSSEICFDVNSLNNIRIFNISSNLHTFRSSQAQHHLCTPAR